MMRVRHVDSTDQYRYLVKHFFRRFFDFEAISAPAADPVEKNMLLIKVLALLIIPGLIMSLTAYRKYSLYVPVANFHLESITDKCFFLSLSMILLGILTVFEWETLFPDQKDYLILTHLPVETRTIFHAKIAALAGFILIFTLVIDAAPTVLFPGAVLPNGAPLPRFIHGIVSHGISVFLANIFAFLTAISMQGILLVIFPQRVVAAISRFVRFCCLLLLLCALLSLSAISRVDQLIQIGGLSARFCPPIWFVGIYEVLLGSHEPVFWSLAGRAVEAMALAGALSILTYVACYRRFMRKVVESNAGVARNSAVRNMGNFLLDHWLIRKPEIRALFHFLGQTIFRSSRHALYVGSLLATGLSIAGIGLVTVANSNNPEIILRLDQAVLSVPLILSFFLLVAMRVSFSVPVDLDANWLFRLAPKQQVKNSHAAVRKFLIGVVIIPLFGIVGLFYALIWNWPTILLSVGYGMILSWILMELLLSPCAKIPFTCSYLPGGAQNVLRWPFYLLGFGGYGYAAATLEVWLLGDLHRFVYFYGMAAAILVTVAHHNVGSSKTVAKFEEESEIAPVYLDMRS